MKIMILVNKNFEYAGYVEGVESRKNYTPNLKCIGGHNVDHNAHDRFFPSAEYTLESDSGTHTIEEYCINYMFPQNESSSNSQIKHELLMKLFRELGTDNLPDYIISVGTSESTKYLEDVSLGNIKMEEKSVNGCVFMGNKFYAKDCRDLDDPPRQSNLGVILYLESKKIFIGFNECVTTNQSKLTEGMVKLPNKPAKKLECIADPNNTSLGVVNIINYGRYPVADEATSDAFDKYNMDEKSGRLKPVGIETTHAVVRMAANLQHNIPVLFVSPIVDRFLCFKEDVVEDWGEQNLKGSYNAGVVVANMLECFRNEFPKNFKEEE